MELFRETQDGKVSIASFLKGISLTNIRATPNNIKAGA